MRAHDVLVAVAQICVRALRRRAERVTTGPFDPAASAQLDRLLAAEALIGEYRAIAREGMP